ncbi:MAG: METTL5 family protein [Methanoregulaceae archaeon]|jgi:putative methylase|nr:METTL5 family protein [Methanoregulaceae archaeon]
MKLRQLEMLLERVSGFSTPASHLEQYPTSAPLAARMLFHAAQNGDITGKSVCDLGCGTGILAIGASLLGAEQVTGIDIDEKALEIARQNADKFPVTASFLQVEITSAAKLQGHWDTIVMNPPFGAQVLHADRAFIDCSLETGNQVYMIVNTGSIPFVRSYVKGRANILETVEGMLPIRHCYHFHRKEIRNIRVEIIHMERCAASQ